MKILVKNIKSNPFRRVDSYPIDREKIERLKISIQKTSFWDNLIARPHPTKKGKYQIAYGHHRLLAIIELGIKEINIPVRKLDDITMLQMMADENLEWYASPIVINETIYAVKDFLDAELAKVDELKYCDKFIIVLFKGAKGDFKKCKKEGVGRIKILKFLNGGTKEGNWKEWMIEGSLQLKREDEKGIVDRKAVEEFGTQYQASQFRKAVKDYHVPKIKQRKMAKKLSEEKIGGREIPREVRKTILPPIPDDFARLERDFEDIEKYGTTLRHKISACKLQMKKFDVTGIGGPVAALALSTLIHLRKEIDDFFQVEQVKQIEGKSQ